MVQSMIAKEHCQVPETMRESTLNIFKKISSCMSKSLAPEIISLNNQGISLRFKSSQDRFKGKSYFYTRVVLYYCIPYIRQFAKFKKLDLNEQTKVIFILGINDKFYVVKMFQTTSGLLSIKLSKVSVPATDILAHISQT